MSQTRYAATRTQVLMLEGEDALTFAHGQFTSDVQALTPGHWQWSGWLDVRGQVLAFFMLARLDDDRLVLVLRGGDAMALAKRLLMYRLRTRVRVHLLEEGTLTDAPALPAFIAQGSPQALTLGRGDFAIAWTEGGTEGGTQWQQRDLADGIPWLHEHARESLLAPALSFERLGAISYRKGCYPGQEVAARIHFRGKHKKHLTQVQGESDINALPTHWQQDGRDIGLLLGALPTPEGWQALVVMRDETAEAAGDQPLPLEAPASVRITRRYGD
ncbi:folate-binding protein YgfZ [Oleiagrimonas sp. C23AA]|uniref:CAF17-like 4Fe-4S cluster assembly/insertion protein YgfZ n=1 Tax=Oleiagrimonas sp. C23AA TaxID=2719047 RepID=UPI0014230F4A|nr:folate-binding protein YgfZ [Oleiagrimonas sp. C23AA]NII09636.1 folate-binding protein YgfZ [Oleiagrimonas sp. C23AA]